MGQSAGDLSFSLFQACGRHLRNLAKICARRNQRRVALQVIFDCFS